MIKGDYLGDGSPAPMLTEALREATEASDKGVWEEDLPPMFTLRHQVAAFWERVSDLAVEFSALPRGGDTV
ncbi:MAG: hypothetical protein L0Z47_02925 [Actinobacteria bacterium]|nr:hypothetical protein [Actinomycetota bacterium]